MLGYIRFWFQAGAVVIVTMFDSVLVILFSIFIPGIYNYYKHYKRWSKSLLFLCGIKLSLKGMEHLKAGETYIYISNHSTLFDIPIILSAIKDNVRIFYKKELEKVPVFGFALKKSPFIPIARAKGREAIASLEEALSAIRQNVSVLLFPEGTRSKDGKLQPFRRGAFMLASRSGKPIMPVTIIGSPEILPRKSFRFNRSIIHIVFHEAIYPADNLARDEEQELMERVHAIIEQTLAKNE